MGRTKKLIERIKKKRVKRNYYSSSGNESLSESVINSSLNGISFGTIGFITKKQETN